MDKRNAFANCCILMAATLTGAPTVSEMLAKNPNAPIDSAWVSFASLVGVELCAKCKAKKKQQEGG